MRFPVVIVWYGGVGVTMCMSKIILHINTTKSCVELQVNIAYFLELWLIQTVWYLLLLSIAEFSCKACVLLLAKIF